MQMKVMFNVKILMIDLILLNTILRCNIVSRQVDKFAMSFQKFTKIYIIWVA